MKNQIPKVHFNFAWYQENTKHKVQIKDDTIIAAVELSQRYITNRFLPDKAIDLMDEAASKLRMEINSKPKNWMFRSKNHAVEMKH
jgi:ATP-dependent Clp protease ATP-binding subunit ClpA